MFYLLSTLVKPPLCMIMMSQHQKFETKRKLIFLRQIFVTIDKKIPVQLLHILNLCIY